MPQMAPLNWLTLMIIFITILIMFNIKNYFLMSHDSNTNKLIKYSRNLNTWKW